MGQSIYRSQRKKNTVSCSTLEALPVTLSLILSIYDPNPTFSSPAKKNNYWKSDFKLNFTLKFCWRKRHTWKKKNHKRVLVKKNGKKVIKMGKIRSGLKAISFFLRVLLFLVHWHESEAKKICFEQLPIFGAWESLKHETVVWERHTNQNVRVRRTTRTEPNFYCKIHERKKNKQTIAITRANERVCSVRQYKQKKD